MEATVAECNVASFLAASTLRHTASRSTKRLPSRGLENIRGLRGARASTMSALCSACSHVKHHASALSRTPYSTTKTR